MEVEGIRASKKNLVIFLGINCDYLDGKEPLSPFYGKTSPK